MMTTNRKGARNQRARPAATSDRARASEANDCPDANALVATNAGALNNGGTDTIPWTQITTTPAALAGYATQLTPPTLANTTSAPVTLTAVNKVVDQGARWTYAYANNAIVPSGTYGGVNVNNGRVTYTATLP